MRRTAPGLASVLAVAALVTGHAAADARGRLVLSPDGSSVWILTADGAIAHVDLASGRGIPWMKEGANPSGFSDIAVSGDGRSLYALLPDENGRTTLLQSLDTTAREETSRWEVRGEGRFLVVTSDGARACVVGIKPVAVGRRRSNPSADDWTLTVVDLATGTVSAPVVPALEPHAVALMEEPDAPTKVLLAATDRVATFTVDPLRVSSFYKSPGENLDVAVAEGSAVVILLRGGTLALIDPARRPRERGRVQLTDDDATSVVPLPARGRAVAVSRDGSAAAVLHDDALTVTMVDLAAGRIIKTERLDSPRDLLSRRMAGGGDDPLRVPLASSATGIAAGAPVASQLVEAPAPRPVVPAAAPPAAPPPEPPADTPSTSTPPSPAPPSPPPSSPPPSSPPPSSPPPSSPSRTETERAGPPSTPPEPPAAAAETPPPIEPPRVSSEHALAGRVTGEAPTTEVLLFGPNNILKLHAKAAVGPDGTFRLPLPPPGSYRVLLSAGPNAHIFARPEFRTVVVTADTTGLDGIDFEVRGRIR